MMGGYPGGQWDVTYGNANDASNVYANDDA